jgi:type II secretory pathway pseudopilin PulG
MNYCPRCGRESTDTAKFCANCGGAISETPQAGGGDIPKKVENHLLKAILTTIFCCLPFGVVSIVFASQVNSKLNAGDVNGARQASNNANLWGNIAIGLGLLYAALLLSIAVPRFSEATVKAKFAEAPRVLAAFESAYKAAAAAEEHAHITSTDQLIFEAPASQYFIYRISDDVLSCTATATVDLGKFTKGNYIVTTYDPATGNFRRDSSMPAIVNETMSSYFLRQ